MVSGAGYRLAELAGLPSPISTGEMINGTSLFPVFEDPDDTSIKSAAYSQFAKPSVAQPYLFWPTPSRNETEIMGYTVVSPYTAGVVPNVRLQKRPLPSSPTGGWLVGWLIG